MPLPSPRSASSKETAAAALILWVPPSSWSRLWCRNDHSSSVLPSFLVIRVHVSPRQTPLMGLWMVLGQRQLGLGSRSRVCPWSGSRLWDLFSQRRETHLRFPERRLVLNPFSLSFCARRVTWDQSSNAVAVGTYWWQSSSVLFLKAGRGRARLRQGSRAGAQRTGAVLESRRRTARAVQKVDARMDSWMEQQKKAQFHACMCMKSRRKAICLFRSHFYFLFL